MFDEFFGNAPLEEMPPIGPETFRLNRSTRFHCVENSDRIAPLNFGNRPPRPYFELPCEYTPDFAARLELVTIDVILEIPDQNLFDSIRSAPGSAFFRCNPGQLRPASSPFLVGGVRSIATKTFRIICCLSGICKR
jgi:hypothetical protein